MASRGPVVSCVLLDGSRDEPTCAESFDLKTASVDVISQLEDLAKQLSSKIAAFDLDAVVIRVADFAPVASRSSAARHRLLVEGALCFVARGKVSHVEVRTGKDI